MQTKTDTIFLGIAVNKNQFTSDLEECSVFHEKSFPSLCCCLLAFFRAAMCQAVHMQRTDLDQLLPQGGLKMLIKAMPCECIRCAGLGSNWCQPSLGLNPLCPQPSPCTGTSTQRELRQLMGTCGYSGLHFKYFQSSTNPESVLSFVHIRSMDLHFPCTPLYISVPGIGRLTANSHDVNLVLLSFAGSTKKTKPNPDPEIPAVLSHQQ